MDNILIRGDILLSALCRREKYLQIASPKRAKGMRIAIDLVEEMIENARKDAYTNRGDGAKAALRLGADEL